jgi:hypothetical protein
MFHRSSVCLATVALIALSAPLSATQYEIGTRVDVVAADGLCSLREAMLAVNTQRGYIGNVPSDERGVTLLPADPRLSFQKEVRNVSGNGSFSTAGSRLIANRGDLIEYRITVTADQESGDVDGVSLGFLLPDQDPAVQDAGIWRSYRSAYIAGSTKLNGRVVQDASGAALPLAPAAPLTIEDASVPPTVGTANTPNPDFVAGRIRAGQAAEVIFRVRVQAGANEAEAPDLLPPPDDDGEPVVIDEDDIEYLVEAECPAGTGSNTIGLKSVPDDSEDAPVQYQLTLGPLVLGDGQDRNGNDVLPAVILQPRRDGFFDRVEKKNVSIIAAPGERVFEVTSRGSLTLGRITLIGNGSIASGQNGGLILGLGSIELRERTLLRNGVAESGGAMFLDGNRNFIFEQARFEDNHATAGHGGALATASSYAGIISGARFHFTGNSASANGGAIYLNGTTPSMFLQNGTFYGNSAVDGSAVRIETDGRISALNNITIAGNEATAGVALSYQVIPAVGNQYDELANSALLGNVGGDCAADDGVATVGSGLTLDRADIAYVISSGATPAAPSCGPLDAQYLSQDGEPFDYSLVDFGLLVGRDPSEPGAEDRFTCDVSGGAAACRPIEFKDGLRGFLPNIEATYSGAPAPGYIEPTLVSAGSPEDAALYVCQPKDQRDLTREPRCDAGAIELQIAAGTNDEFRLVQGDTVLIDVLANDIGDLIVDCLRLTDPQACIGFFLLPRRTELLPLNWVSGVTSPANPDGVTSLWAIDGREGVYRAEPDPDAEVPDVEVEFPQGYPLVMHTPLRTFHGVDQLRYFLDRDAVIGPSYAGANPSANANLVVEPETGLTNRGSVSTLAGSFGWLGISAFAGLLLRRRRLLLPLMLLGVSAHAADIRVNTLLDSAQPQDNGFDRDGLCSLREALLVSIDRSPFFFPDCTPGATGRDRIIIDVDGIIELQAPLEISNSGVDIEGRGPEITIIQPAAGNQHRLILTTSSITLRSLTLAGGYAATNGGAIFTSSNLILDNVAVRDSQALGNGGAIYLNYNAEQKRKLTVRRSYFSNNTAGGNGGVLSMVGQNSQHDLFFDGVTFSGNTAPAGAGGALDVNLPVGGDLRVLNSTFVGNDANKGGAVDLLQTVENSSAYFLNSTFVDNTADMSGAIEMGNGSARVIMSNSIYVGSGGCSNGSNRFVESYFNLFSTPRDPSCEAASDISNAEAAEAEILKVINDGVLTAGEFISGRYIPPHLPIVAQAREDALTYPAGALIIDAGNNAVDLVANDSTPRACRALDLRGTSRQSGGRCDIGAYELQVPTAIDDSASNKSRSTREVRFDVLFNDLVGDGVPDGAEIVDNEVLRGTIDLDPSTTTVDQSREISVTVGSRTLKFNATKVHNGSWTIGNTAEQLEPGRYDVVAVVRNRADAFVASARQTVIVRESGEAEDDDVFVVSGSSGVSITSVDNDPEGDFVIADGRLTVHGLTDAEDGSIVELFIDNRSVGEVTISVDNADCGVGSSNEAEDCIVRIVPTSDTVLTCDDLSEGGFEVTFPYAFSVFNDQSATTTISTPAQIVATFANLSPRLKGEVRRSVPGRVERFTLDLNDPDAEGPLPLFDAPDFPKKPRFKLRTAPKFSASVIRQLSIDGEPKLLQLVYGVESYGVIDPVSEAYSPGTEGIGLLLAETGPGQFMVTYTPRDNQGQFNDRFVLGYEDECGAVGTAEFRVVYPKGANVTGSVGGLIVAGLLLLAGRRRRLI